MAADTQVIHHTFVLVHEESGLQGIHADSTDEAILTYTSQLSASSRVFPVNPSRQWVVFIREGSDRARLWSVVENLGQNL